MKRIGIITCSQLPNLLFYDRQVRYELQKMGYYVEALVWDSKDVKWNEYDMLLMRTAWGYHNTIEQFREFLGKVERAGVPMWNPVSIVRENLHKYYLKEIESKGFRIIPTRFLDQGSKPDLGQTLKDTGWDRFIIKPAISAGSSNTNFCMRKDAKKCQKGLDQLVSQGDVLLQKYMPEVEAPGEWSITFFSNGTSYSILKTPQPGDFRVQFTYGGEYTRQSPPEAVYDTAREIASLFLDKCLYARIDGIATGDEFHLMEAELIEPDLYLNIVPEAKDFFLDAILQKINLL